MACARRREVGLEVAERRRARERGAASMLWAQANDRGVFLDEEPTADAEGVK